MGLGRLRLTEISSKTINQKCGTGDFGCPDIRLAVSCEGKSLDVGEACNTTATVRWNRYGLCWSYPAPRGVIRKFQGETGMALGYPNPGVESESLIWVNVSKQITKKNKLFSKIARICLWEKPL